MDFSSPLFWMAVLQIIAIDVLLGGDNAVVIALACRRLPPRQRNQGIFWGVVGAVGLRIVLLFFAVQVLAVPGLKALGALLLLWIGVKLLLPENESEAEIESSTHLLGAIKTVVVADAVMSVDNVVAVAGAANDNFALVVIGILVSVPLIVWGSKLVLALMERFPPVITLGAALLGWIAGEMLIADGFIKERFDLTGSWLRWACPTLGALLVVAVGTGLTRRRAAGQAQAPLADLAAPPPEGGGDTGQTPP